MTVTRQRRQDFDDRVESGQLGYAIELYGPVDQWQAVYASMWQGLVTSFQPAS